MFFMIRFVFSFKKLIDAICLILFAMLFFSLKENNFYITNLLSNFALDDKNGLSISYKNRQISITKQKENKREKKMKSTKTYLSII